MVFFYSFYFCSIWAFITKECNSLFYESTVGQQCLPSMYRVLQSCCAHLLNFYFFVSKLAKKSIFFFPDLWNGIKMRPHPLFPYVLIDNLTDITFNFPKYWALFVCLFFKLSPCNVYPGIKGHFWETRIKLFFCIASSLEAEKCSWELLFLTPFFGTLIFW